MWIFRERETSYRVVEAMRHANKVTWSSQASLLLLFSRRFRGMRLWRCHAAHCVPIASYLFIESSNILIYYIFRKWVREYGIYQLSKMCVWVSFFESWEIGVIAVLSWLNTFWEWNLFNFIGLWLLGQNQVRGSIYLFIF